MALLLTDEELKNYFQCLRNLKPGDQVEFYLSSEYGGFTHRKSTFTAKADVLGILDDPNYNASYSHPSIRFNAITILIGAKDRYDFATIQDFTPSMIQRMKQLDLRGYNRFLTLAEDILIAKVIKKTGL